MTRRANNPHKKGIETDIGRAYVALIDRLHNPPPEPAEVADIINTRTKYAEVVAGHPMEARTVQQYRRYIEKRGLQDTLIIAGSVEHNPDFWRFQVEESR